jgi:hypothetical protein
MGVHWFLWLTQVVPERQRLTSRWWPQCVSERVLRACVPYLAAAGLLKVVKGRESTLTNIKAWLGIKPISHRLFSKLGEGAEDLQHCPNTLRGTR